MRLAAQHRPAQRLNGIPSNKNRPPRRLVGHVETFHTSAPCRCGRPHRGDFDVPAGVGDPIVTGRSGSRTSEPPAVEQALRTVSSSTLDFQPRKFLAEEVQAFAGLGDPRARVHLCVPCADLIRQRLAKCRPPDCTTTSSCPRGHPSAALLCRSISAASLPASSRRLPYDYASSANSDGLQ